jgi:HNH endonuclease
MLTHDRLLAALHYDPITGALTWKIRTSNRIKAGDRAGSHRTDGYFGTMIDSNYFLNHRLAWFYVTGQWPSHEIDHRNGIRSDNSWSNLREASRGLNCENQRRARPDNSTGVLGVRKMRDRFQANIRVEGHSKNLGTYDTPQLAHAAYVRAKRLFHLGNTL